MNGQQALGYTRDVLDLSPLADRWRAFGWDAQSVDGHDVQQLVQAMAPASKHDDGPPRVVVAETVFGRGVPFMEKPDSPGTTCRCRTSSTRWRWRPWRKFSL